MQKFNEAVTKIGASKEAKPTNAQKLLMYGYFKFVQQGACTTQRPGWTDPVGQSKWDAWKNVDADSTKDDVCRLYIELVDGLLAPKK
jgi:acyl-CoA-binding protein